MASKSNVIMLVFFIGVFLLIIFLIFLLVIGGILIWPLINLSAFLKVLIFPSAVRKKYGSNISGKNSSFFDQAITAEDEENLKILSSEINSVKDLNSSKCPGTNFKIIQVEPPDFQLNKFFYKEIG